MNIEAIKKNKDRFLGAFAFLAAGLGYAALAGLSLFIPFLIFLYGLHLMLFRGTEPRRLLHLGLLLAVIVFTASLLTRYVQFSPDYIPVAAVAMLTMLLFNDLQLAFSMALISSAVVTLTIGGGADHLLIFFTGSLVAIYAVRDAHTRGTLIVAGLLVGLVQIMGYLLIYPGLSLEVYRQAIQPYFMNGLICSAAVLATLRVFEFLFGELTNFSLLELSDSLNQPLLKRLAFEAPGTYHHSLIVSNLAAAAADAIGANQLLSRVGAYYHDIGKLVKPQYFTENQMMSDNKHDDLEPSMSRLVILNHIKEGAEFARANGLNDRIVDFILQHHGTSLIHFFYQRALAESNGEPIDESNYRYPGPKPQTKETAIMMLADSVEGATRAMDEHTPTKIDEVVRRVVNNKFIDGQFDECNLTLREIDAISRTFTRVLSAMYHVRIKYPDAKNK